MNDDIIRGILSGHINQFNFVINPKIIFYMGRFLCKIGVELICSISEDMARMPNLSMTLAESVSGRLNQIARTCRNQPAPKLSLA